MPCRRCGQCCTYVVIKMQRMKVDPAGMEQWFQNHHLKVYPIPGKKNVIGLRIPLTCRYLEYDTDSGIAFCMDYENRPKLCRDYMCPIAKKE